MGKKSSSLRVKQLPARIQVYNQQDKVNLGISKQEIIQAIEYTLKQLKHLPNRRISVIFINDEKIKDLNKRYRKVDTVTDVLVFPYSSAEAEIYISVERASTQAKEYKQTLKEEIIRLIVHALLHCLGWRDENPEQRKEMWTAQEKILKNFFSIHQ